MPVALQRMSGATRAWYRFMFVLFNTPLVLQHTPDNSDSDEPEDEYWEVLPPQAAVGQGSGPVASGSAGDGGKCPDPGAGGVTLERRRLGGGISRLRKEDLILEALQYEYDAAAVRRLTCPQLRALIREARALIAEAERPEPRSGAALPGGRGLTPAEMTRQELIQECLRQGAPFASTDSVEDLRRRLRGWSPAAVPKASPASAPPVAAAGPEGVERIIAPPTCVCGRSPMILRRNRAVVGNDAWFWGCSVYPQCRQTFPYVVPP